jgi:hypothetical protein
MKDGRWISIFVILWSFAVGTSAGAAEPEGDSSPSFLRDRGAGVTTSLFGTYVNKGQWLLYPFYEYERNSSEEYHGSELGFTGDLDYLGESTVHEAGLFVAYGLAEDLAVELEGVLYENATLERAPDDTTTGMPDRLEESGFGSVEAQLRWRFRRETQRSPEWFCNFEVGFPFQRDKVLIGESDWEFAIGLGAVKGFPWGTLTPRISLAYDGSEEEFGLGEYAVEYLKRLSDTWRVVATIEGEDDEISLIGEVQWHVRPNVIIKLNSGFGVTAKSPDVAPEVGVMFVF